jgi:hypothetical protein
MKIYSPKSIIFPECNSYENLFTHEYHISRGQRQRGIWYSWVNKFSYFPIFNVFFALKKPDVLFLFKKYWRYVSIFKYIDAMLLNLDPDRVYTCSKQFSSKPIHRGSQLYFHIARYMLKEKGGHFFCCPKWK